MLLLAYAIIYLPLEFKIPMSRPLKYRYIKGHPPSDYFKPRGIPLASLEVSVLTLDEFEAVRLANHEGLYQEQAAEKMGISRQTFGNILESARRKIADALVNSKAIRIEGGVYRTAQYQHPICPACDYEWLGKPNLPQPKKCPQCGAGFRGRGRR